MTDTNLFCGHSATINEFLTVNGLYKLTNSVATADGFSIIFQIDLYVGAMVPKKCGNKLIIGVDKA